MTATSDLYRIFDVYDRLIYVGISVNALTRMQQHRGEKDWWSQVARIEVEHYQTREDAAKAEKRAIRKEQPLYNVQHDQRTDQEREQALSFWGLLCHAEPKLAALEKTIRAKHEWTLNEDAVADFLKTFLGWRRGSPKAHAAPEDPVLVGYVLDDLLDAAEVAYEAAEPEVPKEALLRSQMAFEFAQSYIAWVSRRVHA